MLSTQLSFLPYLRGLEIAQPQKPASKTFMLSVAAIPRLIFRHSSLAKAKICGATSQRVWNALPRRSAPQQQLAQPLCPKLLHQHQFLQLRLAVSFHFSRSFAIFNPALDWLLETARHLLQLKAVLMLLTRIRHPNRLGCACLLSTQAATLYLPSMRSR